MHADRLMKSVAASSIAAVASCASMGIPAQRRPLPDRSRVNRGSADLLAWRAKGISAAVLASAGCNGAQDSYRRTRSGRRVYRIIAPFSLCRTGPSQRVGVLSGNMQTYEHCTPPQAGLQPALLTPHRDILSDAQVTWEGIRA